MNTIPKELLINIFCYLNNKEKYIFSNVNNYINKTFWEYVYKVIFVNNKNYIFLNTLFNKNIFNPTFCFTSNFNSSLDKIYFPNNTKKIILGYSFNQPLYNLPPNLEELYFVFRYNIPLYNLPKTIRVLDLGYSYNIPLDTLPNLEVLLLSEKYNYTIDNLPNTITILCLGSCFNTHINKLPESLIDLFLFSKKQLDLIDKTIDKSKFKIKIKEM
jgi:hypothetical protein